MVHSAIVPLSNPLCKSLFVVLITLYFFGFRVTSPKTTWPKNW